MGEIKLTGVVCLFHKQRITLNDMLASFEIGKLDSIPSAEMLQEEKGNLTSVLKCH